MTHRQLLERRARLRKQAPPLDQVVRGSLFSRSRRCGTPSCHCASGEGHTTTYLGVTLAPGRTVQVTVPADLLPVVRTWTENYDRLWKILEEISAINRELLRQRCPDTNLKAGPTRTKRS
jgi:hypothetical protein